jgi:hypothetical protein
LLPTSAPFLNAEAGCYDPRQSLGAQLTAGSLKVIAGPLRLDGRKQ